MSDGRVRVRPGKGCLVRLSDGRRLTEDGRNKTFKCPASGVEVRWSLYIQRRLDCGDLIDLDTPDPQAGDAKAKAPAPAAPAPAPVADSK